MYVRSEESRRVDDWGLSGEEKPVSIFGPLINATSLFFEETEVARYTVLAASAGGFRIPDAQGISDRHFLDVDAPGLVDGSTPVIFFRTTHAGSPLMSVRLNQTRLTQHTFADDDTAPRAWHEIVPAGALRPTGNELTFAASSDDPHKNSVIFSDVVILYTSNRLTVRKPRVVVATQ